MLKAVVKSIVAAWLGVATLYANAGDDIIGNEKSVTGVTRTIAVKPVVVAGEGDGKVTLRFDLPPVGASARAQGVDAGHTTLAGPFDDFYQQAHVNTSTGAYEITGDNPNGNGTVSRGGNCTVGRISWISGYPWCWRIPTSGGYVQYSLDVTGYQRCTDVDVIAVLTAKDGNASAQISINSSYGTTPYLDETWRGWSITKPSSAINWDSDNNYAKVNIWNGSDTMGVSTIRIDINGAVPVTPPPDPFDLLSPANHAADQLLFGILRWEASTDVDHYNVYLGTDPQPNKVGEVTGTHYDYSGLSSNTKYYWGILAVGEGGQTRSTPFAFDFTTGALPGAFSLASPTDNATNQDTSGTLRWGSSSGATGYDVYFGTSNPPPYQEEVTGRSTSYSASPGQTCYWYVVAKNAIGERECNSRFQFSTRSVPGSFSLTSPANNATNQDTSGTLSWGSSSGATSYDVYFGTSNPPPYQENVTGASASYSADPGQTYHWYVVAKNAVGERECNTRFQFTTRAIPGSFSLTSPADSVTNQDTSDTLRWGASTGATSYDVYFGTSNPPPYLENVTGTSAPYSGCDVDRTYHWYVKAKNAVGEKECNSRFQFTTSHTGAVREEALVTLTPCTFGLDEASPNPFRGNTSISYAIPRDGSVRLAILNASGVVVRALRDGLGQKGLQRVIWNGTDDRGVRVGKGVYFCSLEAGEFAAVRKMVKTD